MTDRELIEKLSTRKRFAATFWRELAAARKANPMVSRAEVFNRLEDLYEDAFGEELWTYDTFRHSRQFREECGTD